MVMGGWNSAEDKNNKLDISVETHAGGEVTCPRHPRGQRNLPGSVVWSFCSHRGGQESRCDFSTRHPALLHSIGKERPAKRQRRQRTVFNKEQLHVLEEHFINDQYPSYRAREDLAARLNLEEYKVQPLGPGTPAHSGAHRCYGSFARSPYSWSDPSDPLLLCVTGDSSSSQPLHTKPNSNSGNARHLHALVGPSMAFVFLVSLISFLVHHWCPDAKDAAMMNSQPEVGRRVNQEDPDAEELNEVTYTDLDCSVFTWKNITPTSQRPRESSADASVYMDLATC
ncbi:hypothetical protein G4228_002112 [Cervus hanglu yarkandensis]|nr:hypothetical protein G4228_002112 [Cervus hanglu yarkandensis]